MQRWVGKRQTLTMGSARRIPVIDRSYLCAPPYTYRILLVGKVHLEVISGLAGAGYRLLRAVRVIDATALLFDYRVETEAT